MFWRGVGVGIVKAERIQRQPGEGPLAGFWLDRTTQVQVALERISDWLTRLFMHRLIRDILRFVDGCHEWGRRYLNKYAIAGGQTLMPNHCEKILNLVERSHLHGATHETGVQMTPNSN